MRQSFAPRPFRRGVEFSAGFAFESCRVQNNHLSNSRFGDPNETTTSEPAQLELLHGQGAHTSPLACIEDLSADQAAKSIAGFPHSIPQLVFHMNYWMDYELRRIRGQRPLYPQHSAESFPPTPFAVDEKEWNRLKENFASLLSNFTALAKSSREELSRQIESMHPGDAKLAGSLEAVIWQMVAHNSYHTGQIVLLRRALGAWPPQSGGDAW